MVLRSQKIAKFIDHLMPAAERTQWSMRAQHIRRKRSRGGAKRRPAEKKRLPGGRENAPRSGVPAAPAFLSLSGTVLQNASEFHSGSNEARIGS